MLHSVTSSSQQLVPPDLRNPPDEPAALRPPASENTPLSPAPTRFEDLPNEIIYDIAGDVFAQAVDDPQYDVESLACNNQLRSVLHAELHANQVLRKIHSADTFAQLDTALAEVGDVFPAYRQTCLIAAFRLLPRLGPRNLVPETLWSKIRDLLPAASDENSDGTSARDTVLLALVEAVRPMRPERTGCLSLENILAAMDPQAPVGPALEAALMRWIRARLQFPYIDSVDGRSLRDRVMPVAPLALRARMQQLFDFTEQAWSDDKKKYTVATMARQMQELDDPQVTDRRDRRWRLHQCTRSWRAYAITSAEFDTLYRAFFSRLDPAEQVWLLRIGHSPLAPGHIAPFLAGHVGRVPGTTLLGILDRHQLRLTEADWAARADLVRKIVGAAMGTPEEAEVLHAAINYESVHYLELRPFFKDCIAAADPQQRVALTVRLDVLKVGSGEYDATLAPSRAAISARIDALLEDTRHTAPRTIEAIANMNIGWLNRSQTILLLERVLQLPPATRARCLVAVFAKLECARSVSELPPAQFLIDACRSLPDEYCAGPVSAMLELLRKQDVNATATLRQGITQLYDSLPTASRPLFNSLHAEVMQEARNLTGQTGVTPPDAAARRRR